MNHPKVFIIPVMMLTDYLLTVWGAILSQKKYQQHFKIEHYELNPIWQKSIAQKKWVNPKHLAIVGIFTAFCFLWSNGWAGTDTGSEVLFGYLVTLNASLIGTHLSNILTFQYVNRHPDCMSGEIRMSHPMMLNMAQFRLFGLLSILAIIAIFSPTPFIIGGVCSQFVFLFVKLIWIAKANAAEKKIIPPKIL
jgi:hypothetical protein